MGSSELGGIEETLPAVVADDEVQHGQPWGSQRGMSGANERGEGGLFIARFGEINGALKRPESRRGDSVVVSWPGRDFGLG